MGYLSRFIKGIAGYSVFDGFAHTELTTVLAEYFIRRKFVLKSRHICLPPYLYMVTIYVLLLLKQIKRILIVQDTLSIHPRKFDTRIPAADGLEQ